MEKLGRFPLSVILSFLEEADGVALLSTKRVYYNQLLPIFRVSSPPLEELSSSSGRQQRHRYRFRVVPVHDVSTLLARTNTKRLYRRRRMMTHHRVGLTTSQLAQIEWQEQQQTLSAPFPPHLELLRLSDYTPTTPTTTPKTTTILLASYPRSGNTLVRSLWEAVTNVVTGSDTRPDLPLAQQLDFCGEGYTTPPSRASSLFLCKTHWPERRGYAALNDASAVMVLVRNPYDAIDSYWNMNATCTHTETVMDAVYHTYRTFFNRLVRNEIRVWIDYLTYWERERDDGNNILFVRYEDVARDPAGQVTQMLQFAMHHHHHRNHHHRGNNHNNNSNSNSNSNSNNNNNNNSNNNNNNNINNHETEEEPLSEFWQHRIRHAIAGRTSGSLGVYRPRTATGRGNSFGKSLKRYSKELIDYIEDTAESDPNQFLRRFGYSIRHQNFPANFVAGEPPRDCRSNGSSPMAKHRRSATTTAAAVAAAATTTTTTITINIGASIRPSDCPFGRHMQAWRHSVTNNDQTPLPTVIVPPQP
jgi:Sulfotransferase domain